MDIILKEIVAIIKEETENINKKIYGTTFLEILKEKILNRQDQISLKNLVMQNSNIESEENINVLDKNLIFNELLSKYSWFNIGGPAEIFFRPSNFDQLTTFLKN